MNDIDQFNQISQINRSIKNSNKLIEDMNSGYKRFTDQIKEVNKVTSNQNKKAKKDYLKSVKSETKDDKAKIKRITDFFKKRKKEEDKSTKQTSKNINSINKSTEDLFDDIEHRSNRTFKSLSKSFEDLGITLAGLSIVDNLGDIKSGIQDEVDSYVELSRDIKKHVRWTSDEWSKYSKTVSQAVKDSNYQLSRTEMNEISSKLVIDLGIDNISELDTYLAELGRIQTVTGNEINDLEKIIKLDRTSGANGELVKTLSDLAVSMDNNGLNTNSTDILSTINDNIDNFRILANGNNELQEKMLKELVAVKAAGDDSYYGFAADMLSQMSTMTATQLADLASNGLTNAGQIQNLMKKGNVTEAGQMLADSLSNALKNESMKQYLMNNGIADESTIADAISNGNTNAFTQSLQNALDASNANMISVSDKVSENLVGPIAKLKNWFTNLKPIAKISDLFSNYNVTLANAANASIVASRIGELSGLGKNLFDGLSGMNNPIGDFITKSFVDYDDAIKSGSSRIKAFSEMIHSSGNSVKGTLSKVSTKFTRMLGDGGTITKLLTSFGDKFPALTNSLGSFGSTISKLLGGTGGSGAVGLSAIGATAFGVVGALTGLVSAASDFKNAIKSTDKDEKKKGLFSAGTKVGMVAAGAAIGTAIAPGIGTAVGAGIGGILAKVSGSKVGQFLMSVWDLPIFDPLRDGFNFIKDGLSSVFNSIKSVISSIISPIKEVISTIKESISNVIKVGNAIKSVLIKNALAPIKIALKIISGLLKVVGKVLSVLIKVALMPIIAPIKAIGKIFSALNKVISKVKDIFTNLKDKISAMFEPVRSSIQSIRDTFSSIGKAFEPIKESIAKLKESLGMSSDSAGFISGLFNIIGKIIQFSVVPTFKVLATVINVLITPIKWLAQGISSIAKVVSNGISNVVNFFNGIANFIKHPLETIKSWKKGNSSGGLDTSEAINSAKSTDGSHKNGLSLVPFDGYVAELHKNEAILTSDEASLWRSLIQNDGLNKILKKIVDNITNSNTLSSRRSVKSLSSIISNTSRFFDASRVDGRDDKGTPVNEYSREDNDIVRDYTKTEVTNSNKSDDNDNYDNSDVVSTLRWMVNRLEKKLDEVSDKPSKGGGDINNYYNNQPYRKSDEVFQF